MGGESRNPRRVPPSSVSTAKAKKGISQEHLILRVLGLRCALRCECPTDAIMLRSEVQIIEGRLGINLALRLSDNMDRPGSCRDFDSHVRLLQLPGPQREGFLFKARSGAYLSGRGGNY